MGYYTEFTFGIHCDINGVLLGDSRKQEVINHVVAIDPDDDSSCSYMSAFVDAMKEFPAAGEWSASDIMKWYDHEDDMKVLSLKFADIVFLLSGKGEEDGDLWRKYFLNGRMQVCQAKITIEFEELDPYKLK